MNIGGGGAGMMRSPFTVSQWQELEHQALIFKYMMAGLPVPPDLVLPIQKSFDSISHSLFHHPATALGYCSFYGKKVDPEPGRCRRTDGKKWRCSKDAYPDSKYCERHMHRGRNRSRKLVESQTMSQSSSTVTSLTATGSSGMNGSVQNLPFHQTSSSVSNQSHYFDSIPYGIPCKDYRHNVEGPIPGVGEQCLFSEASGSNKGLEMDSNTWPMMPSGVSLYPQSKPSDNLIMRSDYPQHSFFGSEFASVKQEGHSLRPFFDEWPKSREHSNQTSFSTTQLSMSIPMDSSATSSRSPPWLVWN